MAPRTIAGRYEVGLQLSQGTGNKVLKYAGKDLETGETVIVAVVRPGLARDPFIRAEYLHGIERLKELDHPGIVRIIASHEDLDRSELIYIAQWRAGSIRTLMHLLAEGAIFTERQAVDVGLHLLEALEHAHSRGVHFGNVKPSNVQVTTACDQVRITGFPKPPFELRSIPQLGSWLGYPGSCAPELLATGKFDGRADVYGAGLVLYELCAGELPYKGTRNLGTFFAEIMTQPLPPVSRFNEDVPPALERVIARAVEKDPAKRFETAAAMREALSKVPARSIPLLSRERLRHLASNTLPYPIAHTFGSVEHQADEPGQLNRLIDVGHVTVQLLGSLVIAERVLAKSPPLPAGMPREKFARPSLGHWVEILRDGGRETSSLPRELASVLVDERGKPTVVSRAVDALVALRNDVRHGPTLTVPAARGRLESARALVETILGGAMWLREHDLFVARSLDFDESGFTTEAQMLRGRDPTHREKFRVSQPLTRGRVYFASPRRDRIVSLHPLVLFQSCPICQDEELFFYESLGDSRVHYFSFQKGHALSLENMLDAFETAGLAATR
jgi:serine/threonine protein kinase